MFASCDHPLLVLPSPSDGRSEKDHGGYDMEEGKADEGKDEHEDEEEDVSRAGTEATHVLEETFGRAELWRRMLGLEPRTETAVLTTIVAENQDALDQGLVLPCAPSDEEKVVGVIHRHGVFSKGYNMYDERWSKRAFRALPALHPAPETEVFCVGMD